VPVGVEVADTTPALTRASNRPEILGRAGGPVFATTGSIAAALEVSEVGNCCAELGYVGAWGCGYRGGSSGVVAGTTVWWYVNEGGYGNAEVYLEGGIAGGGAGFVGAGRTSVRS